MNVVLGTTCFLAGIATAFSLVGLASLWQRQDEWEMKNALLCGLRREMMALLFEVKDLRSDLGRGKRR